jgi:hypothetical protein
MILHGTRGRRTVSFDDNSDDANGVLTNPAGEIDISENLNFVPAIQMALHTAQGCNLAVGTQVPGMIVCHDCHNNTKGNQGRIIQMPAKSHG